MVQLAKPLPGCQPGICEGLCTGEAARQCYLRTLQETDKARALSLEIAQNETANLNKLRMEAGAALSTWLGTRDQDAAARIQKLINAWPCQRVQTVNSPHIACVGGGK